MNKPQDTGALGNYYLAQEEPVQSCMLALRDIILAEDEHITNQWKYGMPFFCYRNKMFCYLWLGKKHKHPYLGIVEGKRIDHPKLIVEKRSRMKIMLFDPALDLPIQTIRQIVKQALDLYRDGVVKI